MTSSFCIQPCINFLYLHVALLITLYYWSDLVHTVLVITCWQPDMWFTICCPWQQRVWGSSYTPLPLTTEYMAVPLFSKAWYNHPVLSTKTHQTIRHSQSTSAPCSQAWVVPTHMSLIHGSCSEQLLVCSILFYLHCSWTHTCVFTHSDWLKLMKVCVCVCVCVCERERFIDCLL